MSFNSTLLGGCPPPFYNADPFPASGGFTDGRICLPVAKTKGSLCCLPCPATQWVYNSSYEAVTKAAAWMNIASLVMIIFLLTSYVLLPTQYTRSHYLNTCLLISGILMNLGFIIPHASHADECANAITPNDMYSSTSCAFSGAFVLSGGLTVAMWIFVRALSMHLQICWDISPGRRFFYWTQLLGWAIPAALFTAAITATGASFRFGPGACHVNHAHSMADFWGWLIAMSGIAIFLQFGTMFYCTHIYLQNVWADDATDTQATESQVTNTYTSSQRAQTARAIYTRLKRVLWMQWRGLALVSSLLIEVIFFSVVFVLLDNATTVSDKTAKDAEPWLTCLTQNPTNPQVCFDIGQRWLVNQATISAVLLLLSMIGMVLFASTFRWSFFTGWREWFMSRFISNEDDFVTLDTERRETQDLDQQNKGSMFEMQQPGGKDYGLETEQGSGSPSMSTVGTPTEKHNGAAMQYGYARSREQSSQGLVQTLAPLGHVIPHQQLNANPTYADHQTPAGYTQQPAQYQYQPQVPRPVYNAGAPFNEIAPVGQAVTFPEGHPHSPIQQLPGSESSPPGSQVGSAVTGSSQYAPVGQPAQAFVPEYAHQNVQSQPQEMQQPGQSVGLAMRYDDSQPGHVVYR